MNCSKCGIQSNNLTHLDAYMTDPPGDFCDICYQELSNQRTMFSLIQNILGSLDSTF